jgi:transposase
VRTFFIEFFKSPVQNWQQNKQQKRSANNLDFAKKCVGEVAGWRGDIALVCCCGNLLKYLIRRDTRRIKCLNRRNVLQKSLQRLSEKT